MWSAVLRQPLSPYLSPHASMESPKGQVTICSPRLARWPVQEWAFVRSGGVASSHHTCPKR